MKKFIIIIWLALLGCYVMPYYDLAIGLLAVEEGVNEPNEDTLGQQEIEKAEIAGQIQLEKKMIAEDNAILVRRIKREMNYKTSHEEKSGESYEIIVVSLIATLAALYFYIRRERSH